MLNICLYQTLVNNIALVILNHMFNYYKGNNNQISV